MTFTTGRSTPCEVEDCPRYGIQGRARYGSDHPAHGEVAGRSRSELAESVLATARDHEKRVYAGEGIRGHETISFLRAVEELAVEVIRATNDASDRTARSGDSGASS